MVQGSAVYCTLLLSDHYLPGATVLAHSLRDNGSKAKLVALFTPDSLQPATIQELQAVYDELIPVHPLTNITPANLWLMDRPDLIATFTKIELWRQTQYKRIVYIDCDVVALRAPDELLDLEVDFAAVPDVGWPDCFNSGVMVLRPNLQDYLALRALAERGISFDGADQGLLNMHFRDWHRLSFSYNCTPSANYQYIPAYKHFQSTISMIHFIGAQKPWNMARQVEPIHSPYNQLLGRWWAVYDRHYRPVMTVNQPIRPTKALPTIQVESPHQEFSGGPQHDVQQPPHRLYTEHVYHDQAQETHIEPSLQAQYQHPQEHQQISHQDFAPFQPAQPPTHPPASAPSYHTQTAHEVPQVHQTHAYQAHPQQSVAAPAPEPTPVAGSSIPTEHEQRQEQRAVESVQAPIVSAVPRYVRGEEHVTAYIHPQSGETSFVAHNEPQSHAHEFSVPSNVQAPPPQPQHVQHGYHQQPTAPVHVPEEQPPALPSPKPEVQTTFEPPKAEWDASKEPPPLNTKPEGIALAKKTYAMSQDEQLFQPPQSYPEAPKNMYYDVPSTKPEPEKLAQVFPWESHAPRPTRVFPEDDQSSTTFTLPKSFIESTEDESGPSLDSRVTSWTSEEPTESWDTYSRSNAWDEVPEIQRYIQSIQQTRKGRVQVLTGGPSSTGQSLVSGQERYNFSWSNNTRVTDFPSEQERPSLPVTPAPIRRKPPIPGEEDFDTGLLPLAHGVPNQEDWNPTVGLEDLRRRQSEVMENPDLLFERILMRSSAASGHS
ncbi:CAZyme family GT8 [Aspergillus niger]|uniref:glycogenin glucosyltransferase n=1 Tax=Aspergillus niger ATCC 13496 TaxID=1353008 RepID=A0A370CA17_ASPNG|nr:nucleotide-diphospho-sugar transferase [Aspergillus niger CBS 101883]KAI2819191.1 CAZyme family GT8 [Aspergillus niger]RDH24638.1 nucleotide-diphospho-sugar transferase [Aspergillus niger ATCC 13496]KAI2862822.1 CAZyme family GT8 [Aspergillus niger]KAI2874187.1 CAZyme family GT8 [Aspergillus niger]KAI2889843.1 CAZyme family GT8 [Aspergillus niger]